MGYPSRMPQVGKALQVAITGASSDLGRGLIPLLEADPRVARITAIDIARPPASSSKLSGFVALDLTRPGMEGALAAALAEEHIDVLYHLAFVNSRVHGPAFAHELEVIGSMHVLAAAAQVKLPRLVVPSLTALYGARPGGPTSLEERHPLAGCKGSRFITDRVEVEHQLELFAGLHPETRVVVLRFAPIVGAHSDNPFTRLLRTPIVPTVLGFDPVMQCVAEQDAFDALHLALAGPATGVFNVIGDEVMALSTMVRLAGSRPWPLPGPLLRQTIWALETANVASVPVPLLDYLKHAWIADGRRAATVLGYTPRVPVRQALARVPNHGS